VWTKPR